MELYECSRNWFVRKPRLLQTEKNSKVMRQSEKINDTIFVHTEKLPQGNLSKEATGPQMYCGKLHKINSSPLFIATTKNWFQNNLL